MYFSPCPNLNQSRGLPLIEGAIHFFACPAESWLSSFLNMCNSPLRHALHLSLLPLTALATEPCGSLNTSHPSPPSSRSWPLPGPLFRTLFPGLVPYLFDLEKLQLHGEVSFDNSRSDSVSISFSITAPFFFLSEHLTHCNFFFKFMINPSH